MPEIIPIEIIENKILIIRGQKVLIDRDLIELYGIQIKALNQVVRHNIERFPDEFMFKLNDNEKNELITNCDRFKTLVHSSFNPYAFTEYGVEMLSSLLNGKQAVAINIQIIKTFAKLKELTLALKDLSTQLNKLEKRLTEQVRDDSIGFKEQNEKINEMLDHFQYLLDKHKPFKIGFKISH